MSGDLLSTQNFSVKFDKVNWSTFVNGPSYIARKNSISLSSAGANIKTWISLVDRKHKAIQWQKNSTAGTSVDHPNRCFHKRVGSTLQRNLNREEMVVKRTATPHKFFRTNGCKICSPDFHKNLSNSTIHIQMDNKVALPYLLKMGGTHSLEPLKISKWIWHYLLSHGVTITAEYLPSKLNAPADW